MAGKGGKREGAGRPKGSRNKRTEKQEQAVKKSGLTPLEYLLSVMRDESAEQRDRTDAAKAAAPYVHPKLSQVDLTAEVETVTDAKELTDEELLSIAATGSTGSTEAEGS